jgi:predicted permease
VTYPLIYIAILLTLMAAADLVFAAHSEWSSRRRMVARAALVLLFVSEGAGLSAFSLTNFDPAPIALIIAGAMILSLILTQYTTGLFRWSASLAGVVLILWWVPILAILTSSPGFR